VLTVSSTGALNLQPSSGQVAVTGNNLVFNQPAAIEVAGTLTLNPSTNIIAFPNGITMKPSLGSNLFISTSGTSMGVTLQRGDSLGGSLILANHHLMVATNATPTISYQGSTPPVGWSAVILVNSNDTVGAFSLLSDDIGVITFFVNFAKPYTGTSKRWVVLSAINGQAGNPGNFNDIYPLNPDETKFEVTGSLGSHNVVANYSYLVIGVI
jgi:hypothetical protein